MFDLKAKLGQGSIALAKNLSIGEREYGALGEQSVLWVFFAGCSLKSPATEILSMASEHLKTLG